MILLLYINPWHISQSPSGDNELKTSGGGCDGGVEGGMEMDIVKYYKCSMGFHCMRTNLLYNPQAYVILYNPQAICFILCCMCVCMVQATTYS